MRPEIPQNAQLLLLQLDETIHLVTTGLLSDWDSHLRAKVATSRTYPFLFTSSASFFSLSSWSSYLIRRTFDRSLNECGRLAAQMIMFRGLVYLKFWTLNLRPLMVYPKVLFPPNLTMKGLQAPYQKRLPEEEGGDTQATYAYAASEAGAKEKNSEELAQVSALTFRYQTRLSLHC